MAAYEAAGSLSEASRELGMSSPSLCRKLRSHDPHYLRKSRQWRTQRRDALLLYIHGHSLSQIGGKYQVSKQAVAYWLKSIHPNYSRVARQGVFASTADFLRSRRAKAKPAEMALVEKWLIENLPDLVATEGNSELSSFSRAAENTRCARECSHYDDYREFL